MPKRFALAFVAGLFAAGAVRAQTPPTSVVLPADAGGAPASAAKPPAQDPQADFAFGAYQRGLFVTALREAIKRVDANSRDTAAMTLIGEIYRDGIAVKLDDAEASHWYRLASNLGDRQAAFALGLLLLNGARGVEKDRVGAAAQFEKAAALGHAGALYNLGVMAIEGEAGGQSDFDKAAALFRRAAEAGDDNGAYSYGVLLRQGRGAPLDIAEAAHWLKRAADGGIIAGQVEYAIMLFNGVGVEKNEEGAAKIFLKAAAKNNPIAQNRLAHLYVSGRGVAKDLVQAALWHRFAKAAGIDDAELDAATAELSEAERAKLNEAVHRQAAF